MPLASPCSNSATYGASFTQESEGSYIGFSPGGQYPLCQNGSGKRRKSRKSRKKTKRKKKAGALATIVFATAAYCTLNAYRGASAFVLMYNALKKPDEPLTVTQATIDYLKDHGRGLLSFDGLKKEEKMKLANGYDAYITRNPDKISVEVRPEETFGVDPEDEALYADAREAHPRKADAGKKGRASYKPKRGKKSRRKSRRKKRSQRGASLGPPPPGRGPTRKGRKSDKSDKSLGPPPAGKGPTRKGQKPKKSLGLTPVRKGPRREGVPPEPHISEGVTPNIPRHDDPLRPEERWICNTNKKCVRAPKSSIGEKYYPTPNECMKKTKCKEFEEYEI